MCFHCNNGYPARLHHVVASDCPGDCEAQFPSSANDQEWWNLTKNCGGCGEEQCHPGPCVGELCTRCPVRIGETSA